MSSPSSSSSPSKASAAKNQRVLWIDYAKGIGIFLVVIGHTLRGMVSAGIVRDEGMVRWVDEWIYAFHMPLFFFLSGLFIERSVTRPYRSVLLNKLETIAYPYFVWSILQEMVRRGTGVSPEPLTSIWKIVYDPVMQFWFLYVLFALSVLYVGLRKLGVSMGVFFVGFLAAYVATGLGVNLGSWGVVYMLIVNALYFAAGSLVSRAGSLSIFESASSRVLISTAVMLLAWIVAAVALGVVHVKALVPILAFIGIAASIQIAMVVSRTGSAAFFHGWGVLSLEIFVAHTIFSAAIRVVLLRLLHVTDPSVHFVAGVVAGIAGPLVLVAACRRVGAMRLFTLRPT